MDKTKYMKDWWAEHPDLRKEYEKKRKSGRTPEERAKLKEYLKAWRLKNIEEVKRKDREKYLRRRETISAQDRESRLNNPSFALWKAAKSRAGRSGLDFDISVEDVHIPEKCPVFGSTLFVGKGIHGPNSPSIDRVDTSKGYVKGNVCVISHRANCIKRDATAGELRLILAYIERETS